MSPDGAWEAWLVFFLRAVETQALDAIVRATRLFTLRERYHEQIAAERAAERLGQVFNDDILWQLGFEVEGE